MKKPGKGRRLVCKTSVTRGGIKFDVLLFLEAHAALADSRDLEGDPGVWQAQERAIAQAAAEAAAQFCFSGHCPEILDAEITVGPHGSQELARTRQTSLEEVGKRPTE